MIDADQQQSVSANKRWWDADADDYHAEHGAFLGDADFVWCPENLHEAEAGYLGEVRPMTEQMRLKNELNWYSAVQTLIGKVAVQADKRTDARQQQRMGDNG